LLKPLILKENGLKASLIPQGYKWHVQALTQF
jgi:hypothetical protein